MKIKHELCDILNESVLETKEELEKEFEYVQKDKMIKEIVYNKLFDKVVSEQIEIELTDVYTDDMNRNIDILIAEDMSQLLKSVIEYEKKYEQYTDYKSAWMAIYEEYIKLNNIE